MTKLITATMEMPPVATQLAAVITKLAAETAKMGRARCPHGAAIVTGNPTARWGQSRPTETSSFSSPLNSQLLNPQLP